MEENMELGLSSEASFASYSKLDDTVSIQESHEARTVASRQRARSQLAMDVERFIARGGAINRVPALTMADPPRHVALTYGSRPI